VSFLSDLDIDLHCSLIHSRLDTNAYGLSIAAGHWAINPKSIIYLWQLATTIQFSRHLWQCGTLAFKTIEIIQKHHLEGSAEPASLKQPAKYLLLEKITLQCCW